MHTATPATRSPLRTIADALAQGIERVIIRLTTTRLERFLQGLGEGLTAAAPQVVAAYQQHVQARAEAAQAHGPRECAINCELAAARAVVEREAAEKHARLAADFSARIVEARSADARDRAAAHQHSDFAGHANGVATAAA
jgi:hypothetical protein